LRKFTLHGAVGQVIGVLGVNKEDVSGFQLKT
jgi:hypothetical protein